VKILRKISYANKNWSRTFSAAKRGRQEEGKIDPEIQEEQQLRGYGGLARFTAFHKDYGEGPGTGSSTQRILNQGKSR